MSQFTFTLDICVKTSGEIEITPYPASEATPLQAAFCTELILGITREVKASGCHSLADFVGSMQIMIAQGLCPSVISANGMVPSLLSVLHQISEQLFEEVEDIKLAVKRSWSRLVATYLALGRVKPDHVTITNRDEASETLRVILDGEPKYDSLRQAVVDHLVFSQIDNVADLARRLYGDLQLLRIYDLKDLLLVDFVSKSWPTPRLHKLLK